MKLHVSKAIGALLERAAARCIQQGLYFVGVEHVFATLLDEHHQLPASVAEPYLNQLFAVAREVNRTAWTEPLASPAGDIHYTPRCIEAVNRAGKLAERFGRGQAEAGHLLLAILSDSLSAPSRAMDGLRLGRETCIRRLEAALCGMDAAEPVPARAAAAASPGSRAAHAADGNGGSAQPQPQSQPQHNVPAPGPAAAPAPSLPRLTRDLRAAALRGDLDAAVGREREMFEILQVFTRKTKNNVILVGDAGVGKTQLVEGIAREIAQRESGAARLLPEYRILELNLAALMAGTQYRGAFEEKILALLDELKGARDTILFIDEIHLIMGAGATDGDGMDFANLLKPPLARGEIRCIGATTLQEYRKFVERDPAIERRFQMVRVEALSEKATLAVLEKLQPALEAHHGVVVDARALRAAVSLSQRYLPNRVLPDKAIDVLDQACARYRLRALTKRSEAFRQFDSGPGEDGREARVTPHDIRKVVSQMAGIPLEELTARERMQLTGLDRTLAERLIGQDEAIARVVATVKKARVGLNDPNRPQGVMLFLGPSGVGKTQLAKLLADALFGSPAHLVSFDMSEYVEAHAVSRLLGAPPGYAGSDEEGRLSAAVRAHPYAILLFDEIEKAHPQVFDIFLPILDEGRLKDARGRDLSFRNCYIILTSNIGADLLGGGAGADNGAGLLEALRAHFRPEFINRIDQIVPFYPLLREDIRSILRLEVNALRRRLRGRRIGIRMYQQAYEYLMDKGYSPEFGARELRRAVDQHVAAPLSDRILRGDFGDGDMIDVLMDEGALVFRKGRPHSSLLKPGKLGTSA